MNNILTSSTEPYDLSLSRSFQNLSHLPPSYELALKSDSCRSSSFPSIATVTRPPDVQTRRFGRFFRRDEVLGRANPFVLGRMGSLGFPWKLRRPFINSGRSITRR